MDFNSITGKAIVRITMILLFTSTITLAHAQTFAEWFKQSSTQKEYLLEQIEALQVYSGYLKKGYSIAKGGLGSISGSLLSENGMHSTYYNELKKVNPMVANDSRVKEIVRWQKDVMMLLNQWAQINGLSPTEKSYLQEVRSAVYKDCEEVLTNLQNVVSDGKMEMSDADRLKLIGQLHTEMQANYRFAVGFTVQAKSYAAQRQQEQTGTQVLVKTYGIH
jgi:hypothetical protein